MSTKAKEKAPSTERIYKVDRRNPEGYIQELRKARQAGRTDWEDAVPHDVVDVVEVDCIEEVLDDEDKPTGKHHIVKKRVSADMVEEYEMVLEEHKEDPTGEKRAAARRVLLSGASEEEKG